MISRILRALMRKLGGMQKPNRRTLHRKWELIGEKSYGSEQMDRVPPWVMEQIAYIYRHGPGSSLGLQTYYLKGKTYRYRLSFSGQGGPVLHVHRRRRSK